MSVTFRQSEDDEEDLKASEPAIMASRFRQLIRQLKLEVFLYSEQMQEEHVSDQPKALGVKV